jgi:hypothetical protein
MHYNVEAGDIDLNTYLKDQSIFAIKDGHVGAPTGPGLGIDIDEDMVRKIAAETEPWQCKEFYGPVSYMRVLEYPKLRTMTNLCVYLYRTAPLENGNHVCETDAALFSLIPGAF